VDINSQLKGDVFQVVNGAEKFVTSLLVDAQKGSKSALTKELGHCRDAQYIIAGRVESRFFSPPRRFDSEGKNPCRWFLDRVLFFCFPRPQGLFGVGDRHQ